MAFVRLNTVRKDPIYGLGLGFALGTYSPGLEGSGQLAVALRAALIILGVTLKLKQDNKFIMISYNNKLLIICM